MLTPEARLEARELLFTHLLRQLHRQGVLLPRDLLEIEKSAVRASNELQASSVTEDKIRGAQIELAIRALCDGVSPQGPRPKRAPRPGAPPKAR